MAEIKVFVAEGGPYALVETPEEAATLLKHLGVKGPTSLPVYGRSALSEDEAILKFWSGINKNAKLLLSHLMKYKDGVKGERLSEEINLPLEKFGGVLGGASKIAKKYGFSFGKIVESEMRTEGTQRYRWLCAGPLLVRYKEKIALSGLLKLGPSKITTVGA